jgi:hypothetical protein
MPEIPNPHPQTQTPNPQKLKKLNKLKCCTGGGSYPCLYRNIRNAGQTHETASHTKPQTILEISKPKPETLRN